MGITRLSSSFKISTVTISLLLSLVAYGGGTTRLHDVDFMIFVR